MTDQERENGTSWARRYLENYQIALAAYIHEMTPDEAKRLAAEFSRLAVSNNLLLRSLRHALNLKNFEIALDTANTALLKVERFTEELQKFQQHCNEQIEALRNDSK